MLTLFPKKANDHWLILSINDNSLVISKYKSFLRAAWEYQKHVKGR